MDSLPFNVIDYGIIGIVILSAVMGTVRGFVREAMSLVVWVLALVVIWQYGEPVGEHFHAISMPMVRFLVSAILLGLSVLIVGGVLTHAMTKVINSTRFSVTDRIIGVFFGFARGTLIVAVLSFIIGLSSLVRHPLLKESVLMPTIEPIAAWIQEQMPESIWDLLPKSVKKDL